MPSPKALHSHNSPKWGTPQWVIELARELLGYIHLDPASSEEFNIYVKALMIYTEDHNGLLPECEWAGNVFLNPPGGLVNEFWQKLCRAYIEDKTVTKAFWVGFSVEQLCTLADQKYHPGDFSTVILRKRLSFNQELSGPEIILDVATGQTLVTHPPPRIAKGNSPSHGNYLTALGCDPALFEKLFKPYGKIIHGIYSTIPPQSY